MPEGKENNGRSNHPPMGDDETFIEYAKRISGDKRPAAQILKDSLNPDKEKARQDAEKKKK